MKIKFLGCRALRVTIILAVLMAILFTVAFPIASHASPLNAKGSFMLAEGGGGGGLILEATAAPFRGKKMKKMMITAVSYQQ